MSKFIPAVIKLWVATAFFHSCLEVQGQNTFVFDHVNVVPMTKETILKDQRVVIKDGMIVQIGKASSINIPSQATVIHARDKYLVPALSDMHVHLEGEEWNIMFPPETKFSAEEINFRDILFVFLANGITTINVLSASPENIQLREKIKKNELLGPRMILSRMLDGAGKAWPPPIATWVHNAEEAKKAVHEIHRQGYDRIKVYSFLDKASYDTIIATAKSLGIPVEGHVPFSVSVEHVLASGQQAIAHIEEIMKFAKDYSPEQINYYASLISNSDTWVTSALILNRNLNALLKNPDLEFSKPGMEYLHPMGLGIWKFVYENIYKPIPEANRTSLANGYDSFQKPFTHAFYRKGGKLLSGTDALVPSTLAGVSLHEELEELVAAGLTPFEALKVSTTNTFEYLGERDRAGSIETGKIANLLLLDQDPLQNISNTRKIAGVMTQNKWIPKRELDERLEEIAHRYATLKERKFK